MNREIKTNKEVKKAYTDILTVCEKYKDEEYLSSYDFQDIRKMFAEAKNHLLIIKWSEKYGVNFKQDIQINERSFFRIDDYRCFSYFENAKEEKENGHGRYISWSDDGRQPNYEWLFEISFSTGPYMFGSDYPKEIFEKFWLELKKYNPKYCDTNNKNLFFSLDNTKKIWDDFPKILEKYHEINKKDSKKRRIKEVEKELEKLKSAE